jgi:hypothetical protein
MPGAHRHTASYGPGYGLGECQGQYLGPDGALYVTEGAVGRISRVDPQTGEVTTFASGLPIAIISIGGAFIGGAIDVAFIDNIAYALVTLVSPDVGGNHVDGIYRVDGPDTFTVVADIGEFNLANPPPTPFDVPTGLQYALQTYRGGFLVTDEHLNRVLRVTLDGEIAVLIQFDNIVPTGLEVRGNRVYMAEAGPVPHLPQNGKVVSFDPRLPTATEVASGARLLVDVEFGGGRLYALSQGIFPVGGDPGSPALPEHRRAGQGQWGRHLHRHHGRPGSADLARVHREHRVLRHPHRRDLEDRWRLVSALIRS